MEAMPTKPSELSKLLNISAPYASLLLGGDRPWTKALAIELYRKTGEKVGPITDATDEQIDVLEQFESRAA